MSGVHTNRTNSEKHAHVHVSYLKEESNVKASPLAFVIAAGILTASLQSGLASSDAPLSPANRSSAVTAAAHPEQQLPTLQQVREIINASAKSPVGEGEQLFMRSVNLDQDREPEIAAYTNGAVHLGMFYLLDRQSEQYQLIAEKAWNVPHFAPERWQFDRFDASEWNSEPLQAAGTVAGKRLFEVINRTGGTGLDSYEVHLCYLEDGTLREAWEGVLKQRVSLPGGGIHLQYGSYQVVEGGEQPVLLVWETTGQAPDGETLDRLQQAETRMQQYVFDGSRFVPADNSPYGAVTQFLQARVQGDRAQLVRTSSAELVVSNPWLSGPANLHPLHYVIEAAQSADDGIRYRVLLLIGSEQTTFAVEREELLVEQVGAAWRVTSVTRLAQSQLDQPVRPKADESSLAVPPSVFPPNSEKPHPVG